MLLLSVNSLLCRWLGHKPIGPVIEGVFGKRDWSKLPIYQCQRCGRLIRFREDPIGWTVVKPVETQEGTVRNAP